MEKYKFGANINGSGVSGIIDTENMKLICICTKENSELLKNALNYSPPSQSEVKEFYCRQKAIGRRDDTCSEQCDNCKLKN